MKIYTHSIPNTNHPDHNEDRVIADETKRFAAVFDGVGGSENGEMASRTASENLFKQLTSFLADNPEHTAQLVSETLKETSHLK